MSDPHGVARRCQLPNTEFGAAWSTIKLPAGVPQRLLAQALLSLTVRRKLPFESAPLHGLILLKGPPGTGKTTIARGLANQLAKQLPGTKTTYIEIDPHALTSSALGRSQQAVAKLFEQTIPEVALGGVAIVLLDEVETLAVDRQQLSMDANPIDVHRATDAVLAGMDRLTREHKNVLLLATTSQRPSTRRSCPALTILKRSVSRLRRRATRSFSIRFRLSRRSGQTCALSSLELPVSQKPQLGWTDAVFAKKFLPLRPRTSRLPRT